jgi:hypothetical protein
VSDWSTAAITAATLLDHLEADYDDAGVTVGAVMVLVELDNGDRDTVGIYLRCSDARQWAQLGMLRAAEQSVLAGDATAVDEDENVE